MSNEVCGSIRAQRHGAHGAIRRVLHLAMLLLATHALVGASCGRTVRSVPVGGTFNQPIFATAPAGDARLFVVERPGTIRVLDANRNALPTPFLNISAKVSVTGEGGLLGMAFSPNYASDGQFYVYYINLAGDSVLSRFLRSTSDPNVAGTTERVILTVDQPAGRTNHKGGTIAFSPVDGMLYWALGDGGGADDPDNLAQNPQSLLGKMIRINVSGGPTSGYTIPADNPFAAPGDGVLDEIWALGFRNPFRWSFDRQGGDLWIGDVGQVTREEVDFESASDPGGRNYGWKIHEGSTCHLPQPGNPCETPATASRFTFPLYEYDTHSDSNCAITGGVVYRGSVPFLKGAYLFGDSCSNRIWSLGGLAIGLRELTATLAPTSGTISTLVAFGEDGFGEVYLVSLGSGQVFRIQ